MMWLIIVFLALGLTVLLWIGTLFLQGYIYTTPTEGIAWQAPAAGSALALFFGLWCAMVVNAGGTPNDLVYDTLFRFSPRVEMVKEPVKELFAVKQKNGEKVAYVAKKDNSGRTFYQDTSVKPRPWSSSGIAAIYLIHDGESYLFEAVPGQEGGYRTFVDKNGWTIAEFDKGPTGIPTRFVFSRFLANLFLNFFHLSLWFICFWLLLRFQWSHALGLALCVWLLFTLAILPMLLGFAGELNAPSASPTASWKELLTSMPKCA